MISIPLFEKYKFLFHKHFIRLRRGNNRQAAIMRSVIVRSQTALMPER